MLAWAVHGSLLLSAAHQTASPRPQVPADMFKAFLLTSSASAVSMRATSCDASCSGSQPSRPCSRHKHFLSPLMSSQRARAAESCSTELPAVRVTGREEVGGRLVARTGLRRARGGG